MFFKVSEQEWQVAKARLAKAPNGQKVIKSQNYHKHHLRPLCPYKIKHSFIKLNDVIYAIGPMIGKGAFGLVRHCLDEQGQSYVVKVSADYEPKKIKGKKYKPLPKDFIKREVITLDELNLLQDYGVRDRTHEWRGDKFDKHYIVMLYRGSSLYSAYRKVKNKPQRLLDYAISATLALKQLHDGEGTQDKLGHAHLDVKMPNMVVDKDGEVRLVDFAFAKKRPEQVIAVKCGSPPFLPHLSLLQKTPLAVLDTIALKRTIYFPPQCYCAREEDSKGQKVDGYLKRTDQEFQEHWLLSDKMVQRMKLKPYLDTGIEGAQYKSFIPKQESLAELAAILIVARAKLYDDYHKIDAANIPYFIFCYQLKIFNVVPALLNDKKLVAYLSSLANKQDKENVLKALSHLPTKNYSIERISRYQAMLRHCQSGVDYRLLDVLSEKDRASFFLSIKDNVPASALLWYFREHNDIFDVLLFFTVAPSSDLPDIKARRLFFSNLFSFREEEQFLALLTFYKQGLLQHHLLLMDLDLAKGVLQLKGEAEIKLLIQTYQQGELLSYGELTNRSFIKALKKFKDISLLRKLYAIGLRHGFSKLLSDGLFCLRAKRAKSDDYIKFLLRQKSERMREMAFWSRSPAALAADGALMYRHHKETCLKA